MFEHIEIIEIIYEYVVTPSYKKNTQSEANRTGLSRNKRGEAASSNIHHAKVGRSGKRCKRYVDCLKSASKTCMIPGTGHSSDEFKALGEFGTKYYAAQHTNNRGRDPIPKKRLQKKQENQTIINNMLDELCMVESKKVSAVNHEAP